MKPAAVLAVLLVLTGCAGVRQPDSAAAPPQQPPPQAKPQNLVPDDYKGRFRVKTVVLESPEHGPQLCQAVAESYPPQCGGPDIVGWKWDGLKKDSAQGTTWGVYILTGTFDGKLTLTEPAKDDDGSFQPNLRDSPDFTTPCVTPAGGWKPVDAAKATDDALNATYGLVMNDPDFGGLWVDEEPDPSLATPANNPARLVLNIRFTKDLSRHEAEIRKVWGGSLCLSVAQRTEAELRRIQDELSKEPGMSYAGADIITGTVDIGVFIATESRQRELDTKYGKGVVALLGVLEPIDL